MASQAEQFYNAKNVEEDVQRGIQRGIASFRNEVPCSFKDVQVSHRLKYASEEEVNRINVDRESLWEDSIIPSKSPKFDRRGTLRVKFSGEAGGLRMEYCSLLAKAIFSSEASLFEGSSDRYVPIYNASAIQSDIFGLVGKMMSYMIFRHDVPFRCISPAVYEYLVTGDLDKAARVSSVLDVPDWEIREISYFKDQKDDGMRKVLMYASAKNSIPP